MAWHLYLMPMVSSIFGESSSVVPKYVTSDFALLDYTNEGSALVAADVDAATDASIAAQADVRKIPDNLDQQVGGALATVQSELESRNLPSGWVTSTMTYRTVLQLVLGFYMFRQRFRAVTGITASWFGGAVTLDTQFQDLGATVRQGILDTADSFPLNRTGFTGTSTVRQILKGIGDQLVHAFTLGGITI